MAVSAPPVNAAGVPPIAGHWKARFLGVPGTPLTSRLDFRPCKSCAAIALVNDPLKAASQRVRVRRRGGAWVATYRSRSYCGYRLVISFRPRRTRTLGGERYAVTGAGTQSSRGRGCRPGTGFAGRLRFRARRVSELKIVGAEIGATELGDGCNPFPYSFAGEPNLFEFDAFFRAPWSYHYDFGGASSTQRRPRHTFTTSGRHFVTVTIRMTDGSLARGTEPVDVSEPESGC
ncbi:MAG TPA: PKD domain-containing protein [Thermoleophilaceae bacterium]|nr:PKD domain-containing protein [Thermoleophilaceae bacterium]